MFTALTEDQLKTKKNYIESYVAAANPASGSLFDSNANVTSKNIATLEGEVNKDINIQVNRSLMTDKLKELYDEETANKYLELLKNHVIYTHDESGLSPYCASISMYPFLLEGMQSLGGESKAPKHLASFCGSFVNLVFAVSSQICGASATVEWLMYFDYFARKDFGDNYLETHKKTIEDWMQHVVYCLNQPAAARNYQSVFWNISIFDKFYFDAMFGDFVFPDMTKPSYESLDKLQRFFMTWFNKEREETLLTFPVVTAALLTKDGKPRDKDLVSFLAKEMEEGNSFFIYMSDNADSLSSCCRLRSEVADNTFSYSLGAGGVSTGSLNVITINLNRVIQQGYDLEQIIRDVHKFQIAYREVFKVFKDAGMLPIYDAGYIDDKKQFLTLGINGLVEAAEYLGIEPTNNSDYRNFVRKITTTFYTLNREASKATGLKFNTEMVPAENLGVKNAKWDRKSNLQVNRDCYNSYFYRVEDKNNVFDLFSLYSKEFTENLDGGSALHLNLQDHLTRTQYESLFDLAASLGCSYWCVNVLTSICDNCNKISKGVVNRCSNCGSMQIDYATRIIGYLKKISSWSSDRKKEASKRTYH